MKKYLIAGLLVWLPLAITIWVLHSILGALNGMFGALVSAGQAVLPTGAYEPLQLLRNIPGLGVIILIAGLLLTGMFAANMVGQWWLHQGNQHLSGDYVSVYVPTTPNPTSGFFLMVPRSEIVALEMSVDQALKYIISMGVVAPGAIEAHGAPPVARNPVG